MALRLKDRRRSIPNGFLYEQKQTGWKNWILHPHTMWDFNALCSEIQKHRRLNNRFGLPTDLPSIQNEVEAVNAARIAAMPGAADQYLISDALPPPNPPSPPSTFGPLAVAGANLVKMASGVGVLIDWLGSGGVPVDPAVAEARAQVCAVMQRPGQGQPGCPKNGQGGLSRFFTEPAAALITKQLEQRQDLKLSTSVDDKLGICQACGCVNKLKVHVPIDFIKAKMSEQVQRDLDPLCWILKE